ncbi:MAG: DUF420 domain-containing protein [Niabella sp.]
MLTPLWKKNDKKAKILIYSFSVIVFLLVAALGRVSLNVDLGFDVHIFALVNAVINSAVAILLVWGLIAAKQRHFVLHKKIMMAAIVLSVLFLLSYVCHHLLAGDTKFGGEGGIRYFYFFILMTHIPLAGIILPFILFTSYRALIGEYGKHRKLARITWPIWFYVAVTGPIIYILIQPYY